MAVRCVHDTSPQAVPPKPGSISAKPGKAYQEVAKNRIEALKGGKEQVQNLANPVCDGSRMYYRTPGYLECIGDSRMASRRWLPAAAYA
jgi:hypothetical protein